MNEAPQSSSMQNRWKYPGAESPLEINPLHQSSPASSQLEQAIGAPALGEKIANRFLLKAHLGRGGMSVVYRAFDQVKQCEVALKFLSPALLGDMSAIRSFEQEARISMQLNHPHILKVFDLQIHQGIYFLVMELIEGGTLRDWMSNHLDQGPADYHERCRILSELTHGLTYAHEHTLHRDLKPENIARTTDGSMKIMDFGLSSLTSQHQTTLFREAVTQLTAGTPYYMAPELLSGESPGTPPSDQFSLGVIAYELFSGRIPMGLAPSLAEQCPDLPTKLTRSVDRMLAFRPEERFPSVKELSREWEVVRHQLPSKWNRVRRAIIEQAGVIGAFAASLCLTGAALAGIVHWKHQQEIRQTDMTQAWQDLATTRAELSQLTGLIQDKRNELRLLESQVIPSDEQNPALPTAPPTTPRTVSESRLEATRALWNWLSPQISSTDNWLEIEEFLRRAQASLTERRLEQFAHLHQSIQQLKEEVITNIDHATETFNLLSRGDQAYQNLAQLQDGQSVNIKAALDSASALAQDEKWGRANSALTNAIKQSETRLRALYESAQSQFERVEESWQALFPELGAPDLSFIANPQTNADSARDYHSAGQTALGVQQFNQGTTILSNWIHEVNAFNQHAQQSLPPIARTVSCKGIQLVLFEKLGWARWEIRVMDFARWVAEENKLSRESAAFWKNPGYPIGPTHPVVGISRRDAKEFSAWLGYNLTRFGRPEGRLPSKSEWENLIEQEGLKIERPFAIYADPLQWQSGHFREHYADLQIDPTPFLSPRSSVPSSVNGLLGLSAGVWEWTGSFYSYGEQKAIADRGLKWLLAGGGDFGTVAYNAFPPPEPNLRFVLRKEGIGFRPVIVVNEGLSHPK